MTDLAPARADSRPVTHRPPDDITDVPIDGIAAFLGGNANVIMQLSHAPVGYGVLESTVDSGKVTLHPIKRLRTTLTYLAVAMLGTEAERAKYREAVNGAHRQVRSTSTSPVRYNAFDPELQKWVAACLYFGTVDLFERMHGPMGPEVADAVYRDGVHFGSSLQMRPEMWPADRAAFDEYWSKGLADAHIDEPVRRYLRDIIEMKALAKPVRLLFGRSNRFFTVGLLPPDLRRQMGYEWTAADERRLDRTLRRIGRVYSHLPPLLREFPVNWCLWDMRRRVRKGTPLV